MADPTLPLHLFALGPPEARLGDILMTFPTRKTLALLIYLAIEPGDQTREHLAALLWPASSPEHSHANLRNTLGHLQMTLRQAGGQTYSSYLSFTYQSLGLNPEANIDFDLQTVERAYVQARADRSSRTLPEGSASLPLLLSAAACQRGDFLAGFSLGDAHRCLSEALAIARQLGDTIFTAHVLSYLCRTTQSLGEYDQAEKLLRESLALAREINYHYGVGMALDGLGQVVYAQGRNDEARSLFLESYNIFREIGQTHRMTGVLNHQGFNSLAIGDTAEAQDSFRTALRLAYEGGMMPSALDALAGLIALQADKEDYEGTLELAICVLQHQASTQEAKNLTKQLRAKFELHLTQDQVEAAQERASSKSFDELVRQVLAES